MKQKLVIYLTVIIIIILSSCQQKQTKISSAKVVCDSCCLKKLVVFADTLNLETSKSFNYYFDEKEFSLGDCELKNFRGNLSLKSSIVLILLKIDNAYRDRNVTNILDEIQNKSKTAIKINKEIEFLSNTVDTAINTNPFWIRAIIIKDSSLLINKQIKKLFNKNIVLRKRHSRSGQKNAFLQGG